jgi:hypothetical protein
MPPLRIMDAYGDLPAGVIMGDIEQNSTAIAVSRQQFDDYQQ